jgi:hypothetical protein
MKKQLTMGLLGLMLGSSLFAVALADWDRGHRHDNGGRHRWEHRDYHHHHHWL